MDVSDGLVVDLRKLCAASHCGARLEVDALPASAAMSELFDAGERRSFALGGGDDYELLFTVSPDRASDLERAAQPVPVTRIGVMTEGNAVTCIGQGTEISADNLGYDHFKSRS
jgi:thiamine-monophosphate kinase